MAKVRVEQVAKRKVAFQRLNQIELSAAAQAVEQVTEGGNEVINDKEQGQRAHGRRHADEPYFFWTGILELHRKNGKVMLRRKRAEHGQMAAPNWVVARYLVVEDGDAHAGFPL